MRGFTFIATVPYLPVRVAEILLPALRRAPLPRLNHHVMDPLPCGIGIEILDTNYAGKQASMQASKQANKQAEVHFAFFFSLTT